MVANRSVLSFQAKGMPFDVAYQPNGELLAVGTMEGLISLHSYDGEEQYSDILFENSIRSLEFNSCRKELLLMGSKDNSFKVLDINTEEIVVEQYKAHKHPLNKVMNIESSIICTGDDQGIGNL